VRTEREFGLGDAREFGCVGGIAVEHVDVHTDDVAADLGCEPIDVDALCLGERARRGIGEHSATPFFGWSHPTEE